MNTQEAGTSVFNSVPNHNYLGFYDETRFHPQKVVKFLGFNQSDVARAASIPRASVRYDRRIPQELEERLMEIGIICEMVAGYFRGDVQKTNLWLKLPNTLLGNMAPKDMIRFGRYKKLHKFITNSFAGNLP